jgi:hypothetical protein
MLVRAGILLSLYDSFGLNGSDHCLGSQTILGPARPKSLTSPLSLVSGYEFYVTAEFTASIDIECSPCTVFVVPAFIPADVTGCVPWERDHHCTDGWTIIAPTVGLHSRPSLHRRHARWFRV